jgi:hypothetical protein
MVEEIVMTAREKRKLTLVVADIFANDPTLTIGKIAQQLGQKDWAIRMACYRAGIELKVGRPCKNKAQGN